MVALSGADRLTVNVSFGSTRGVAVDEDVTVLLVSPGAKVSVPLAAV